jgi:GTP-binding protein
MIRKSKPSQGEMAFLQLELKMIADIGLVGFPNAGKSSLLAAMSKAMPEIAPYPFTTLNPLVGVIEYRDGYKVVAADVPGLVAGASMGKGKGHDFLRHLERTKALLYIVDSAGTDGRNPLEDLQVLVAELGEYGDGDMLTRPALVVANKLDLLSQEKAEEFTFELRCIAEELGLRFDGSVFGISAGVTGQGLGSLSRAIRNVVSEGETERESFFQQETGRMY